MRLSRSRGGNTLAVEGRENTLARLARYELSAYLATLARAENFQNLGTIASFLLNRDRWGTDEHYAARVIFAELSAALGMPTPPLVAGEEIDREVAARVYLALSEVPPAELRDAARHTWEKLFAKKLPELVVTSPLQQ